MKKVVFLLIILALLFSCDFGLQNDLDSTGVSGVISIDGTPVEGVRIIAQELMPNGQVRSVNERTLVAEGLYVTTSGSDGSYYLELPPGDYTIEASMENTLGAVEPGIIVQSRAVTEVDIVLTATGTLTGTVVLDGVVGDGYGTFVAIKGTSYVALTDNSGVYTISRVPVGAHNIVIMRDGYWDESLAAVTLAAGATVEVGETDLTRSSHTGLVAPGGSLSFLHERNDADIDFNAQVAVDGLVYNLGEYNTMFPGNPIEIDEDLDSNAQITMASLGGGIFFLLM
ncbi:MAG: carboxypeptidase regulatory-like domain-containing protein [Spirochaetales bacterium]|nr:carboxypeptidase regulatory-like domain-containing protein [Spirochaetales bacterium]